MAQTGYTPISIYYSSTAAATPTAGNLVAGELAINTADGKLFYKDSAGVVQVIAGKGGAGVAGGSNTQVQYNSSGSLAGSANMTFDGTNLAIGGYTTSTSFRPTGSTVPTNGMYLPATNSLGFATNSATALTISSTANFGFGVSPNWDTYTSVLQVPAGGIGSYVPNLDLTITQNAYYAGGWKYSGTGLASRNTAQNGEFIFSNAVTGTAGNAITWLERVRITSAGKVGIGTSSPSQTVEVVDATSGIVRISTTSGSSQLQLNSSGTNGSYINYNFGGAGFLSIYDSNASADRIRIDSAGFVGIGTSSPTAKLNVVTSASADVATFAATGTTTNYGIAVVSYATAANTAALMRGFSGTSPTQVFQINGAGNIDLFGGQITFPATQSASGGANTLDDYEEGTWTPTALAQTGSLTSYTSYGTYTKIGKLVNVSGVITLTNVGTAAGAMNVANLPFASQNVAGTPSQGGVCRETVATGVIYFFNLINNNTTGTIGNLTNGPIVWTNTFSYSFNIAYISAN